MDNQWLKNAGCICLLSLGLLYPPAENAQNTIVTPGDIKVDGNITASTLTGDVTGNLTGAINYTLLRFDKSVNSSTAVEYGLGISQSQGVCYLSGVNTNNTSNLLAKVYYYQSGGDPSSYQYKLKINGATGVQAQAMCIQWSPTPKDVRHVIFKTAGTFNGNLGGLAGADAKCNIDSNKPNPGGAVSGYLYKALLEGNNATQSGFTYYRTDVTTKIATATGGNLVGGDGTGNVLQNAIATTSGDVWTGANVSNNCGGRWVSTSENGDVGVSNSSTSTYWNKGTPASCSTLHSLYCVSQ